MTGEDRVIRIGDADDPRIEIYRDIRELDLIRRHGHFIAEGKTVLQVLVDTFGLTPIGEPKADLDQMLSAA